MITLDGLYDDLQALNTTPFGFSVDNPDKQVSACDEIEHLLMISDYDPKGEVSQILGIFDNGQYSTRANLVIDEQGVLQFKKEYALSATPDFNEVIKAIEDL